jgi:hypothetical protein
MLAVHLPYWAGVIVSATLHLENPRKMNAK